MDYKKKPNIILIIMDCARADHLSCYGYHRRTMPYLDQLAAQGVLYETALSPATWSLPAHWSIFTGLYLARHGVWNRHLALSPQYQTMAELLKENGYETAAFSNTVLKIVLAGASTSLKSFFAFGRSKPYLISSAGPQTKP
jgi:arylsulfatase A-like enzyme